MVYLDRTAGVVPVNGASRGLAAVPRTVLVVGPAGTVSASLVHAMEREFPGLRVEQHSNIEAALADAGSPVRLILLDPTLLPAFEAASPDILRVNPHVGAALIQHGGPLPAWAFADVTRSRLIRGVLPMNLGLDIWLCVLRLLLHGGEYFPRQMFQAQAPACVPAATSGNVHLSGLTAREMQILEMVSRGLQNKSIAAAFSLSEHTVKIHLHNIIGKLGVHNRTEAAARFRDRMAG